MPVHDVAYSYDDKTQSIISNLLRGSLINMSHIRQENFISTLPKILLLLGAVTISSCSSESSFSEKFGFTKKENNLGPRRLPRDNQQYLTYAQKMQQAASIPYPSGMQGDAPYAPGAQAASPYRPVTQQTVAPLTQPNLAQQRPYVTAPLPSYGVQANAPYPVPPVAVNDPAKQNSNGMPPMPSYDKAMRDAGHFQPSLNTPASFAPSDGQMPQAPVPYAGNGNMAAPVITQAAQKPSFFQRLFGNSRMDQPQAPSVEKAVTPADWSGSSRKGAPAPQPVVIQEPELVTIPKELPAENHIPVKIAPIPLTVKIAPIPLTVKKNPAPEVKPAFNTANEVTPPSASTQESLFSFPKWFGFKKEEKRESKSNVAPPEKAAEDMPWKHAEPINNVPLPLIEKKDPTPLVTVTYDTPAKDGKVVVPPATTQKSSFSFGKLFGFTKDANRRSNGTNNTASVSPKTSAPLVVPQQDKLHALPEPRAIPDKLPWVKAEPLKTAPRAQVRHDNVTTVSPVQQAVVPPYTAKTTITADTAMKATSPARPAIHKIGVKGYPDLSTVPAKPERFNERNAIKEDMSELLKKQQELEAFKQKEDGMVTPAPSIRKEQAPTAADKNNIEKQQPLTALPPLKPVISVAKTTTIMAEPLRYEPQTAPVMPTVAVAKPLPVLPKPLPMIPQIEPIKPQTVITYHPSFQTTNGTSQPEALAAPDDTGSSHAERARLRAKMRLLREQQSGSPAPENDDDNSDSRNYR